MNFGIFISLALIAGAALVFRKLLNARRRLALLLKLGRVSTWENIQKRPDNLVKIIRTDFGYGKEIWALPSQSAETDLKLRAFKTGVLIVPRPRSSDLHNFCQTRGISVDLMMIK